MLCDGDSPMSFATCGSEVSLGLVAQTFQADLIYVPADAKAFHRLEDWKLDNEDLSRTVYLKRLTAYQRAVARLAYRASGGNEEAASNLFISGTGVNAYSRSIRDQVT